MTQKINHKELPQLLTYSTHQLDAATLIALHGVRENALNHQKISLQGLRLNGGYLLPFHFSPRTQKWLAVILLATTLAGIAGAWQHQHEQQINALDAAILSDELPIDVFVD